jgi:hypothetical protein
LRAFRLAHLDPTASALKTEDQWLAAVSALHADTNTAQRPHPSSLAWHLRPQ